MTEAKNVLEVGDVAPPIEAATAAGEHFSLAGQHGKWVVLFFYPMANTPGWTHESKDFQQHLPVLESLDAQVVGVSGDKTESQLRFIEKYGLTYPMIPDKDKVVIDAYGGRAMLGLAAKRSTYLIDPEGKIAHAWTKVVLGGHAEDVVRVIRERAAR